MGRGLQIQQCTLMDMQCVKEEEHKLMKQHFNSLDTKYTYACMHTQPLHHSCMMQNVLITTPLLHYNLISTCTSQRPNNHIIQMTSLVRTPTAGMCKPASVYYTIFKIPVHSSFCRFIKSMGCCSNMRQVMVDTQNAACFQAFLCV